MSLMISATRRRWATWVGGWVEEEEEEVLFWVGGWMEEEEVGGSVGGWVGGWAGLPCRLRSQR